MSLFLERAAANDKLVVLETPININVSARLFIKPKLPLIAFRLTHNGLRIGNIGVLEDYPESPRLMWTPGPSCSNGQVLGKAIALSTG